MIDAGFGSGPERPVGSPGPGRVALWILKPIVPKVYREALIGDLLEEYEIVIVVSGPANASRWFWGQVLRSIPPLLLRRLERLLHGSGSSSAPS